MYTFTVHMDKVYITRVICTLKMFVLFYLKIDEFW